MCDLLFITIEKKKQKQKSNKRREPENLDPYLLFSRTETHPSSTEVPCPRIMHKPLPPSPPPTRSSPLWSSTSPPNSRNSRRTNSNTHLTRLLKLSLLSRNSSLMLPASDSTPTESKQPKNFFKRPDPSPDAIAKVTNDISKSIRELPQNPYQSYSAPSTFEKFPPESREKKVDTVLASIQTHLSHLTRPIDQLAFETMENYTD